MLMTAARDHQHDDQPIPPGCLLDNQVHNRRDGWVCPREILSGLSAVACLLRRAADLVDVPERQVCVTHKPYDLLNEVIGPGNDLGLPTAVWARERVAPTERHPRAGEAPEARGWPLPATVRTESGWRSHRAWCEATWIKGYAGMMASRKRLVLTGDWEVRPSP